MKLTKINLNQLANADLNEREMCRLLGGGDPGCCQCGCNYANSGGSSTEDNDNANNKSGLTSEPEITPFRPDDDLPDLEEVEKELCGIMLYATCG